MAADGVGFRLGTRVEAARTERGRVVLDLDGAEGLREELSVDKVLVATGRLPNVDDLGLEAAGVAFDRGGIRVDDRLRTTHPRVFASGDVASNLKFTHAADALARIVVQNALFPIPTKASKLVVPAATYTDPELASVGLTAEEAERRGVRHEVLTVRLEELDRMVLEGTTDGFLRLVLDPADKILGATLVAPGAGDVIGELVLAMTKGLSLGDLAAVIHPYPTLGEIVRKAADQRRRARFRGVVRTLARAWVRIAR
jgi:pyruvate/2-oxoglutarate dehydrogenase complex dihydrolipoamide dehydrogenase (E3) component